MAFARKTKPSLMSSFGQKVKQGAEMLGTIKGIYDLAPMSETWDYFLIILFLKVVDLFYYSQDSGYGYTHVSIFLVALC